MARPGEPIAPPPSGAAAPARRLTPIDRLLFVPLGFLWLVFLLLLSVPVMIGMTGLYYLARAAERLARSRRSGGHTPGAEERVA